MVGVADNSVGMLVLIGFPPFSGFIGRISRRSRGSGQCT